MLNKSHTKTPTRVQHHTKHIIVHTTVGAVSLNVSSRNVTGRRGSSGEKERLESKNLPNGQTDPERVAG